MLYTQYVTFVIFQLLRYFLAVKGFDWLIHDSSEYEVWYDEFDERDVNQYATRLRLPLLE